MTEVFFIQVYASHSERGEGSGGRGDFRISEAPFGTLIIIGTIIIIVKE